MHFTCLLAFVAFAVVIPTEASPIIVGRNGLNAEVIVPASNQNGSPRLAFKNYGISGWKRGVVANPSWKSSSRLAGFDWRQEGEALPVTPTESNWRRQPYREAPGPLTGPDW
ncbi:hypothetical protein GALMADRAFT_215080 [Galerina marginata CBS 339.88]|uniref:Uncharacterized protein n=1 Tax=Galerina marginata (strain CBS 339.88) TaxID=685588 RepID=A0A067SHA7_GALM3|nr:hypothetical protein GALMADRAFT_215080 [Galerina marginata CBS 339.88]